MIIDEFSFYDETTSFHSINEGLFRDHIRINELLNDNIEKDKIQEQEISANTSNDIVQAILISGNTAAIIAENERAVSAETYLQQEIDDEIARAISAETAEYNRATSAEADLQKQLDEEIARAKNAEETENKRADTEEKKLQHEIDTINQSLTALNSAISSINSAISSLESRVSALEKKY